jgi:hypothetical protein
MRYGRCELGDRDRRGIGCDDRFRTYQAIDLLENLYFLIDVFGYCLDHDIRRLELLEGCRAAQQSECSFFFGRGDLASRQRSREIVVDRLKSFFDQRIGDIDQGHTEARYGGNLSDAASHRSGPDYRYRSYWHACSLLWSN